MNYATIKELDVANGTGVRVSLFVSGCTHHCPECFNSEAWDFNYGSEYTEDDAKRFIKMLNGIGYFDKSGATASFEMRPYSGLSSEESLEKFVAVWHSAISEL